MDRNEVVDKQPYLGDGIFVLAPIRCSLLDRGREAPLVYVDLDNLLRVDALYSANDFWMLRMEFKMHLDSQVCMEYDNPFTAGREPNPSITRQVERLIKEWCARKREKEQGA